MVKPPEGIGARARAKAPTSRGKTSEQTRSDCRDSQSRKFLPDDNIQLNRGQTKLLLNMIRLAHRLIPNFVIDVLGRFLANIEKPLTRQILQAQFPPLDNG